MITFSNQANVNSVPSFDELLTKMMPHFRFFAKQELKLKGDNYDECIQDLTCMAYENYTSLVNRGLGNRIFFTPIKQFAIQRFRSGRHYLGMNSTDIFATCTQIKGRSELRSIHLMRENDDPKEYLADPKANVSRIVGFKIDFFETWLVQQTPKDQEIIHDLMMGETTGDTAKKYGLSPASISQYKKRYAESWYSFLYPIEEVDLIDELRALAEETSGSLTN